VEPEGRWEECAPLLTKQPDAHLPRAVALPPGTWCVVGSSPSEVAAAQSDGQSCLVVARFDPVWAISMGARRGSTVVALGDRLRRPRLINTKRRREHPTARTWASAIYDAQIRRPRFAACDAGPTTARVADSWESYVRAAKNLKRSWRRP
jgi:hypothetical protein